MKLALKFFYRDSGKTRLVLTHAAPPFPGAMIYQDNKHVYTEDGKFLKSGIVGNIEESLVEDQEDLLS